MVESPYRFQIGDFECIALRDGGHMGSTEFLFVNAPDNELKDALQAHNLEPDKLQSTWTCLLVDTGELNVLIDTGIGSGIPIGGKLLEQLEEENYPPAEIDIVFLTHGHPDHIGGCTDADGIPVFPRARYMMGKQEHAFWIDEENLSGLSDSMVRFASKNLSGIQRQLELVAVGDEILPGIQVIDASGHTPGHLGLEISSEGDTLLHLADSALHPLHIEHPDWYAQVDILPDQMITTRKRLLGRAAAEEAKVLLFHFDFPSMGYVVDAGHKWKWRSI